VTSIKAASGGLSDTETVTMAKIGTFTKSEAGIYTGTLRTLMVRAKVTIIPVEKTGETAPDFRVTAQGAEIGAGWTHTAKGSGVEYIRLKLDDPSFAQPVWANLVRSAESEFELVWGRWSA
jgi:uncharacterized protein (DUF736 family)